MNPKHGFTIHRMNRAEVDLAIAWAAAEGQSGVLELSAVPFEDLCAYDSALFPVPRSRFLRGWLAQPGITAFAAVRAGLLAGYGVLRPCRRGYKVGPLFADSVDIAEDLLQALAVHANGAPIFLDVPETNPAAMTLAKRYGMSKVFETARMYTRQSPALPIDRIFGVTTFELG